MKKSSIRTILLGSAGVVASTGAWWSTASATAIDFSGYADTTVVSTAPIVINSDLTLNAITNIGQAGTPDGKPGVVFFENDSGVGVKDTKLDKKSGALDFDGSAGISGDGGDQDEALQFVFSNYATTSSVAITLNDYKYKKADKKNAAGYTEDELMLLIEDSEGDQATFTSAQVEATFPAGPVDFQMPVIDLSALTIPGNIGNIARIVVTGYEGHFYVAGLNYDLVGGGPGPGEVPAPLPLALLGAGLAGLGFAKRRPKR